MVHVEVFKEGSLRPHIKVVQGSYDRPEVLNRDHIRWKHLKNPFGPSTAITLPEGPESDEILGRSFLVPRDFVLVDKLVVKGATVTDLIVRPDHRSADRLISLVKASKKFESTEVVVHSSNEVSDVFYRKMFKFPVRFSLAAFGFPVRISRLLERSRVPTIFAHFLNVIYSFARPVFYILTSLTSVLSGLKIGTSLKTKDMQAVHCGHHKRTGPQFRRSVAYAKWRFQDGPISRSDLHGIYDRKNQCMGYFATQKIELDGLRFTVLMEVLTSEKLSFAARLYIKFFLITLTINDGSDIAFSMFNQNHPDLGWLSRLPFIKVPDSALPHPSPIFIHMHDSIVPPRDLDKIFFTLADLDYF